jgi:hypothetical protein
MRTKFSVLTGMMVLSVVLLIPSLAFGLTNEYGMHFAGQTRCLDCHEASYANTTHGRLNEHKGAIYPAPPSGVTTFTATGGLPPVVGAPGSNVLFSKGGSYSVTGLSWISKGAYDLGVVSEYVFWRGSTDVRVNPWSGVSGLKATPGGWLNVVPANNQPTGYMIGSNPANGLSDSPYSCKWCHELGVTAPTPSRTSTLRIPVEQTAVSRPATYTTGMAWAHSDDTTIGDFDTSMTVSYTGLGVQCENCHGTGLASSSTIGNHWFSGTQISNRLPALGGLPATGLSTLGRSDVCGGCHATGIDVPGTLGGYGYTPNLPVRLFMDVTRAPSSGATSGTPYTYVPTEDEFMAAPTKYFFFPNGSHATGGHFYYDDWATSGHAYRGALGATGSPDILPGGTHGHYNAATSDLACAKCHTGENYLKSKEATIANDFTPTSSNVGFMGQECIVCHNPHASSRGEGLIREADAAGERSNAGLTTANASQCEDCHNWQYEVMGTTPNYAPLASLASRGGPSHPQRETLHGKVMLEVPVAGEFMPEVTCQECHMPKTNTAGVTPAHGMHIMLPGKAKIWVAAEASAGVAPASLRTEDSCSRCHKSPDGVTPAVRDELQADIDTWQANATAAANEAAAAIVVATSTPEFSRTAGTPGYILVGRAEWNYKAFGSDASNGVHNPPYVLAGLEAATKMAKSVGGSFVTAAPGTVGSNAIFAVAGTLKDGDNTGAAGATVKLFNGATKIGEGTSDENGNFSFMCAQTSATTYTVKWIRSSEAITYLTTDVTVGMTPPPPVIKAATDLMLSCNKTSDRRRYSYKLSGSIHPHIAGASIRLYYRAPGKTTWTLYKTLTASSTGTFAYTKTTTRTTALGTWYWRAKFAGNANYLASSATVGVRVIR